MFSNSPCFNLIILQHFMRHMTSGSNSLGAMLSIWSFWARVADLLLPGIQRPTGVNCHCHYAFLSDISGDLFGW